MNRLPDSPQHNLLAVETSSEACSVALQWNGKVYSRQEEAPMQHAELLLPWVRELLEQAGTELKHLDAIAFGRGPGSFTSLRIGIGAVQGLAWASQLPVIPLSSLAAVAQQVETGGDSLVQVAMDARMGEIFTGLFRRNEVGELVAVSDELVIAPENLVVSQPGKTLLAGTAFGRFESLDALAAGAPGVYAGLLPSAEALLILAQCWLLRHEPLPAALAQAVYIRDNVADKPGA